MVPLIVPLPPRSEVPPIITAAIASSSYPSPRSGRAEPRREVRTTAARPT